METTITQNNALYFAQHGTTEERRAFLQRMRLAATKKIPSDITSLIGRVLRRPSPDNGR